MARGLFAAVAAGCSLTLAHPGKRTWSRADRRRRMPAAPAGELGGPLSEPHAPAGRLVADLAAKCVWW
ncbi:hypothetical protein DFR72_103128 [Lentzea flaviverrucosa]|uniref:Uncharacterized protein n=1 Tax=Lentzea flaviverrucosa TaxID=200379 RepID=A0A1H9BNT5_9PSEU|nr:hypothetical protein DFR72_103128 [Lentzea flaviverrucosa]SEP90193.1 hypothetical protein SAMN05216195_101529 [Lentzea flaviverrucosa]